MHSRTLRALLVGIDAYRSPVPALRGCVNDVERVAAWLGARAAAAGDRLDLRILRDGEASRDAVIEAFRGHLGPAGADDTALFYYSGHGSQEIALPEQHVIEPDELNETLVLADSRHDGVHDLADKELALLVSEVAATAGHVLVVLDCCHSGSGVRAAEQDGLRVRRAPTVLAARPREAFLTGSRAASGATGGAAAGWLNVDGGRYVLLAACRADQQAKEVAVDGAARGAFSVALERALAGIGGAPTYLDVERWVAAAARNLAVDQAPVLEAPTAHDAQQPFLGGVASPAVPVRTAAFVTGTGWTLDAGRLHGIAPPVAGDPTELALHPLGSADLATPLTTARVSEVRVTSSDLDVADPSALDRDATYRAVVTRSGTPLATVAVAGSSSAAEAVRACLRSSTTLRLVEDAAGADLTISATADDDLLLSRRQSVRPLAGVEPAADPASPAKIVATTEQIGWWIDLLQRENLSTGLALGDVSLWVCDPAGDPIATVGGAAEVQYTSEGGPLVGIRYRNDSSVPLHCAVLALSELYGVDCLTVGGSVLLEPGQQAAVTDPTGRPFLQTFVPDGQERTTDVLKLLVSTEQFDAQALRQADLVPPTRTRGAALGTRGFSREPVTVTGSDWTTRQLLVTTVKPGTWRPVPDSDGQTAALTAGVKIVGHPALVARARLAARQSATRSATVALLPPALLEPGVVSQPYAFSTTRSASEELSILELDNVADPSVVTERHPLRLTIEAPLAPGELVLPVASDGVDYLPLGFASSAGGATEIRLDRLPALDAVTSRSLGGSLKILFRKLVLTRLGAEFPYPLLSLVRYEGGVPSYVHDPDAVAHGVRDAQRVLLMVHGIIGDTRGMTAALDLGPDPIRRGYDAVLALDYENIHTRVGETGESLGQRIAAVGLDTGQKVDVVAHSMGGLVSRWWIERAGGTAAVRRLVTCGTPHGGSPWSRVQDLATAGLALGLNQLGGIAGTALAFLLQGVEKIDNALDDMQPGSALLAELAASRPPSGVGYVAITGDEPFGIAGDATRAERILRKLRLPGAALGLLFGGPNDIAVSVTSASAVGAGWPVRPGTMDADCNHMSYFSSTPGLATLRSALTS